MSDSSSGVLRSSALMAVGTIASRLTGMIKSPVIVAAVGTGVFADTYSIANLLPTVVYVLLIGGAINAVFVPQLVRHMSDDADEGEAFAQRLFSAVTLILLVLTVVAVLFAPVIVRLYGGEWDDQTAQVSASFARYCLPQIFFYGLFTVFSQMLNARGTFGPPMFAPIVNNVVVIASALAFIQVAGLGTTVTTVTEGQIALLGLGTTLGVVAQALVLWPYLGRAGIRLRLRTDLKGTGLGKSWTLARWSIVLVLINQIGTLVVIRLASAANVRYPGLDSGATVYTNAFIVYILPHSVITVSVVTALLPQLSRLAHDGRLDVVRERIGWALRLTGALIVPAAALLIALGVPVGVLLFSWGSASAEAARLLGFTLAGYAIGLPAFSAYYVLMRGFFALEDTRTPALNALLLNGLNIAFAYGLYAAAPSTLKVPALALGQALAYWVSVVALAALLRPRLDGLDAAPVIRAYLKLGLAGLITGGAAFGVAYALTRWLDLPLDARSALLQVAAGGLAGAAVYLGLARLLGIRELQQVTALVLRRTTA